jgi:valyl-tRNA synthetase
MNWMENIRDWCISRQLWWGHRIPAWYDEAGRVYVARTEEEAVKLAGGKALTQDPDTLDTWFSSALWPFSTLGWPDKTPELDYFYPTSTLVTMYDIIFFWVARMIFSGVEQMGKSPFATVFIHGAVRDEQGRKMSKTLNNGIDPLDIIGEYGADALRFMLATCASLGSDMRFSDEKVTSARNFANKIWNATRFVLMNLSDGFKPGLPDELAIEDKWALSKYNTLVADVTDNLEKFELGVAAGKLYDFIWDILCDWYIEITKSRVSAGAAGAEKAQKVLVYLLDGTLRLLHPFMPFITEELWQAIPHDGESIMISSWPVFSPSLAFEKEERDFSGIMDVIRGIRARRAEMNVPPSKKAKVFIVTDSAGVFAQGAAFIQRLAYASEIAIGCSFDPDGAVQVVTSAARAFIPMGELIDMEKERARLEKEKTAVQKDIDMISAKLENVGFVAKAPEKVVAAEHEKLKAAKEKLLKIDESMKALN